MTFGIVMTMVMVFIDCMPPLRPVIKQIWQKERINSEDRDGATDLTIIMAEQQIVRGKSHLVLCFRVLSRSRCICIK